MKKKLLLLSLIIFALFTTGCFEKKEDVEPIKPVKGDALIWEVTSTTGGKLYLVGSIHVGKEEMYPLKSVLTDAFNESDAIAVEADILSYQKDFALQQSLLEYMMYLDGTTIQEHIPSELFEKLDKSLDDVKIPGISKKSLYSFKPTTLYSLIGQNMYEQAGLKAELGVDMHFLELATEKNMPIIEIESMESQLKAMDDLSTETQLLLLESTIASQYTNYGKQLNDMLDLWIKGNELEFEEYLSKQDNQILMSSKQKELYEEYNYTLMTKRNGDMLIKAEELLKNKKTYFYIVGSAHMFGETGLVNQLKNKGYTVTKKQYNEK